MINNKLESRSQIRIMPIQNEVDILLLEDRYEDIELTLTAFRRNNITKNIEVVRDGEKAIEFLFATGEYSDRAIGNLPKLIILDLQLPKVNGKEVLRQVRANEETKLVPVVIFTSANEEGDIAESYKLGANSYIVKPVDFHAFVNAVVSIGN